MKKLLILILCLGVLVGCGAKEIKMDADKFGIVTTTPTTWFASTLPATTTQPEPEDTEGYFEATVSSTVIFLDTPITKKYESKEIIIEWDCKYIYGEKICDSFYFTQKEWDRNGLDDKQRLVDYINLNYWKSGLCGDNTREDLPEPKDKKRM